MRNFDEQTITDAVLMQLRDCANPRVRQISEALVRHLHNFVREVQLTQAELDMAIEFLTRTGQMCNDHRQEFVLLSDTLGVSMLVDAINHRFPDSATETTVLGPFYVNDAPFYPDGATISKSSNGKTLQILCEVRDVHDRPIDGAIVDVWLADDEGYYDVQKASAHLDGRGRFTTDSAGKFALKTTVPASYPIPHDGPVGKMLAAQGRHPYRPAHVHFMIQAQGYQKLVTHLFIAGDPYLDSDVVFGVKDSLIHELETAELEQATATEDEKQGAVVLRRKFVLAPG